MRSLDYRTWRKTVRSIAAAANNASSFGARRDLLVAHKEDLTSMCLIMHFAPRDRLALASDVHTGWHWPLTCTFSSSLR